MSGPALHDREILEAFTLLESFTSAGVQVKDALQFAAEASSNPRLKAYFTVLKTGILQGRPLSALAAEGQPRLPPVVTGMLAVAERTGEAPRLLARARDYLTEQHDLAAQVRGALVYPILVGSILVLGLLGLWLFFLPAFGAFARQMGGPAGDELQNLSRNLGTVLAGGLGVLAFLGAALGGAVWARGRSEAWARTLDQGVHRLPLVGTWARTLAVHQFAAALEVLIEGGVALPDALEEARGVVANRDFSARCTDLRRRVLAGASLSVALGQVGLFPPTLVQWVAVGEKTGRHGQVFAQIRRFTGRDLERWTGRFTQLLEPSMTILMGVVMVLLITGFILPLLNVYGNLL